MTSMQTTILIIGSIITAFPLLLLLFRLPGPFHLLAEAIAGLQKGPNHMFEFMVWLKSGWKFKRWDAIKVPLFVTLICAILTALAVLIVR